jgi:hypothetical protein
VIESSNPAPVRSNAGTGRRLAPRTAPQYAACSAFRDTAVGHVLRVEEIPSEKGPPRKCTRSTLRDRNISKSSGAGAAFSLNGSTSSTKETDDHVNLRVHLKVIGDKNDGGSTRHEGIAPANHRTAMDAVERYLMYFGRRDGPSWGGFDVG